MRSVSVLLVAPAPALGGSDGQTDRQVGLADAGRAVHDTFQGAGRRFQRSLARGCIDAVRTEIGDNVRSATLPHCNDAIARDTQDVIGLFEAARDRTMRVNARKQTREGRQ